MYTLSPKLGHFCPSLFLSWSFSSDYTRPYRLTPRQTPPCLPTKPTAESQAVAVAKFSRGHPYPDINKTSVTKIGKGTQTPTPLDSSLKSLAKGWADSINLLVTSYHLRCPYAKWSSKRSHRRRRNGKESSRVALEACGLAMNTHECLVER